MRGACSRAITWGRGSPGAGAAEMGTGVGREQPQARSRGKARGRPRAESLLRGTLTMKLAGLFRDYRQPSSRPSLRRQTLPVQTEESTRPQTLTLPQERRHTGPAAPRPRDEPRGPGRARRAGGAGAAALPYLCPPPSPVARLPPSAQPPGASSRSGGARGFSGSRATSIPPGTASSSSSSRDST